MKAKDKARCLASARKAGGTLVVEFEVPFRPVPWKVPKVVRNSGRAIKDPSLVAWQETVATYALQAMAGIRIYEHPVSVAFHFRLASRPGKAPDLTNLIKAAEDALQGIVFRDDAQVFETKARRIFGWGDGTTIVVSACDPVGEDHP